MEGGAVEDEFTTMLVDRGVVGIIFVSGQHADTTTAPDRYQRLTQRGVPIVLINGYMDGVEAPFFSVDDRSAMMARIGEASSPGAKPSLRSPGHPRQERIIPRSRDFH